MLKNKSVFFVLPAVFLLSVLIRLNQISPVVKSHEQAYILTLQTSEIWRSAGILNCHFTPMWTYNNPGDKFIAYYKRLEDKKGDNYYVSFPPLSFLVAHLALSPFNIEKGKLVLQILNILFHFISALFIYLIICALYNKNTDKLFFPAFLSFIIYSFTPVMLFFHTDIFFPEMLGQVFWIVSIYYILKFINNSSGKYALSLFLILFLFLYAEWIAVFFVFTLCSYAFISKTLKPNKHLIYTSLIALLSAGILMFIQYSSIAGINEMLHSMGIRFLERSGFFGQKYSSMGVHILSYNSLKLFALNLNKALTISGYLILIFFLWLLFKKKFTFNKNIRLVLILSSLPVLIHWIVFFNANAIHLLLMARTAVPLSIIAGVSGYSLWFKYNKYINFIKISTLIIIAFIVYSACEYQINFTFNEKYPELIKMAETIKKTSKPNQAVFINCNSLITEPEKYLTFMSKRNIVNLFDKEDVKTYMQRINKSGDAIIFQIVDNNISEIKIVKPNN